MDATRFRRRGEADAAVIVFVVVVAAGSRPSMATRSTIVRSGSNYVLCRVNPPVVVNVLVMIFTFKVSWQRVGIEVSHA